MTTKRVIKQVKDGIPYIKEFLKEFGRVMGVYIVGGVYRGTAGESSDIDIYVHLVGDYDEDVVSQAMWNEANDPYPYYISDRGIVRLIDISVHKKAPRNGIKVGD